MTKGTENCPSDGGMGYGRFATMIATSTVLMFGLMYLNTYLLSHVFWSETRAYMAILMGAAMAIIMLAFMLSMYASRAINASIFLGAAVVFGLSLWLVRSQVTVGDLSYMRAMIPHHSIAIMTSSRADISDPRVRKLADGIIYAQDKEIAEMRYLVADIESNGDGQVQSDHGPAKIVSLSQALSTAEVATLDPEFMTREDVAQLVPGGTLCSFTYTEGSAPILVVGKDGSALVKLSGDLIRLDGEENTTFAADGIMMRVSALGGDNALDATTERQEADLVLELKAGLRVGYRGFYGCGA